MKKYATLLLALALVVPTAATAQRRKKAVKKPKKEEVVEEDPRITQMLAATQQVMFVDSMVVELGDFMRHIPLSSECGRLAQAEQLGQYTNELGDLRLQTTFNPQDSLLHLTMSHFLGNQWTEPALVQGLGNASANYPYLMPDGTTLYYAQQGEKSIGGYDLFVTRYDAESGAFLRPENIGMPFSSEANDYLYVIDEAYQLGYFVTDRRQPAGKVCIYVFVPSETRRTLVAEAYSDEQLRSLARIDRIADTWDNAAIRQQALARLAQAREAAQAQPANVAAPLSELDSLRHQASVLQKALTLARKYYAHATEAERAKLRDEILQSESELETLQRDIRKREKEARNAQHNNP